MIATSGDRLLSMDAEAVIRTRLLPLAALVTPNLDEAALLTGLEVRDLAQMERAGAALLDSGAGAALVKGGHLAEDAIVDVLFTADGIRRYESPTARDDVDARHRVHAVGGGHGRARARGGRSSQLSRRRWIMW